MVILQGGKRCKQNLLKSAPTTSHPPPLHMGFQSPPYTQDTNLVAAKQLLVSLRHLIERVTLNNGAQFKEIIADLGRNLLIHTT